jgi:hypothetical protein
MTFYLGCIVGAGIGGIVLLVLVTWVDLRQHHEEREDCRMRKGIVTGLHHEDAFYRKEGVVTGMVVKIHDDMTSINGYHVAESLLPGYFFYAAKVHFIGEGGAS